MVVYTITVASNGLTVEYIQAVKRDGFINMTTITKAYIQYYKLADMDAEDGMDAVDSAEDSEVNPNESSSVTVMLRERGQNQARKA